MLKEPHMMEIRVKYPISVQHRTRAAFKIYIFTRKRHKQSSFPYLFSLYDGVCTGTKMHARAFWHNQTRKCNFPTHQPQQTMSYKKTAAHPLALPQHIFLLCYI